VGALTLAAAPAAAQQGSATDARLRAQRDTLEQIRSERAALERRMQELRSSAHDLSEEVANLNSRADATARIVRTLDHQLETITVDVAEATRDLVRTQDELVAQRAVLRRRLVDIYKRGPMFTAEALLSAQSFGDLVARYKYLHLLAMRDRALVNRVEALRTEVQRQRDRLVVLQNAVAQNRSDKADEESRLRTLEEQQSRNLARVQRQAQQTEARIAALRRTETQLSSAIAAFEAERKRLDASRPAAARSTSSIRTSDYGKLDWPVQGDILYPFGRQVLANNTTIRWNGVGIAAAQGTPVHVVASGKVVSVSQLGTYGLTIIVEHGGGDYSIYGSLASARVARGQSVQKGEVIGTVGVSDPDFPPHLHFEIRHGGPAVDPATWLRNR
jgi:septal ring factor EnvC (AmiA/AmiB activator)